jgi:UDP-N-acetylmuramoylalanine--D-glutamate ligase
LKEATEKAKEVTSKGKSCLLSPAAPSYEYFKNYAEKAEKFIECVKIN